MATVETSTVTLSINGREITVPKGLSLVEAAAEAGIEVPVFCYEPRVGPAVGACRMCLVEIEGMPKLQTACTTPAGDGMVVHSASDRAREGQDAVLEFLLINHPLDCPVCDKGGECPLQDLTFRYGPSVTRMTVPKRTHDKPVPISPLIKLDRERCILCYRCTRFSENVSEDLQLVTENRGAHSVITTFEERPYDGEFSGNVTELCPVGALTSTTYRFRGRPWETQQVPTVCGHCAVGCNTAATIREGQVVRVLSRNHPEVDEGWLCDKGRYVHTALTSEDRITGALIRGGRGLEPVEAPVALEHVADRLRATVEKFGPGSVAILASGEQTNEEAHVWARLQREVLGGGPSVSGPEGGAGWESLEPYMARIADIDEAGGGCRRGRRRAGAPGAGDRAADPPGAAARREADHGRRRRHPAGAGQPLGAHLDGPRHGAYCAARCRRGPWRAGDGAGRPARGDRLDRPDVRAGGGRARARGPRAGRRHPAHAGRGQRGRLPGRRPGRHDARGGAAPGRGGHRQGDRPAGRRPGRHVARRRALAGGPGTLLLRAPGHDVPGQLDRLGDHHRARLGRAREGGHDHESRGPRPAAAGSGDTAARASSTGTSGWRSWRTGWGSRSPSRCPASRPREHAELPAERPARPAQAPPVPQAAPAGPVDGIVVVGYRQLMSGVEVDHAEQLEFQRRHSIELAHDDAQSLGVATGDRVTASWKGGSATGPALVNRRLRTGVVRLATAVPHVGPGSVAAAEPEAPADA